MGKWQNEYGRRAFSVLEIVEWRLSVLRLDGDDDEKEYHTRIPHAKLFKISEHYGLCINDVESWSICQPHSARGLKELFFI